MPDAVITEALDIGTRYALAESGVRIAWIIEFPGQRAGDYAQAALRLALENPPEALAGFGIGGIEAGRAPYTSVIRDVFAAARAAGLRRVPHAGETTGPETVWEAIEFLHSERIGHGIRSLDDPSAGGLPAERRLPVDVTDVERLYPVRAVDRGASAAADDGGRAVRDAEQR